MRRTRGRGTPAFGPPRFRRDARSTRARPAGVLWANTSSPTFMSSESGWLTAYDSWLMLGNGSRLTAHASCWLMLTTYDSWLMPANDSRLTTHGSCWLMAHDLHLRLMAHAG